MRHRQFYQLGLTGHTNGHFMAESVYFVLIKSINLFWKKKKKKKKKKTQGIVIIIISISLITIIKVAESWHNKLIFLYIFCLIFAITLILILSKDVQLQSCSGEPLQTSPKGSHFKLIIDFPLIIRDLNFTRFGSLSVLVFSKSTSASVIHFIVMLSQQVKSML